MATLGGPNIIRDGLVLYLDAANPKSYPGTGTTWYDISGNGKHHTIVGSPIFSNGEFTLNETQGFTYTTSAVTNSTSATIVLFYKTTDILELWTAGQDGTYYVAASNNNNYYHGNAGSPTNYVDLKTTLNPTSSGYKDGKYHMWEAKNINFSTWTQNNWFRYGEGWNLIGSAAIIIMYNRILTAAESAQNYNALKGRFNI